MLVDRRGFCALGADELGLLVDALAEDDAFAFASVCRAFRAATCQRGSAGARFADGIRTTLADRGRRRPGSSGRWARATA